MGVAVFSGMLGVTVFGLLLTPVFYVLIRRFVRRGKCSAVPRAHQEAPGAASAQRAMAPEGAHHA